MRSTIRFFVVVVAACVAVVASIFTAFAAPPPAPAGQAAPGLALRPAAQASNCDTLTATNIAWVTLTADHHIDQQVSSYPTGASDITPIFKYSCVPQDTVIVSVFTLNGQTVQSGQETVSADGFAGLYGYALETNDGSPIPDGQWTVQYFNNKTPLTSGAIAVGGTGTGTQPSGDVTVQGVVQDQNSQAPIPNAVILVLNPGVQLQDFLQNGQPPTDLFTGGKSDSQGNFVLKKKLTRHQVYAMTVTAPGYKPLGSNSFQILDQPDPVAITISMTQ